MWESNQQLGKDHIVWKKKKNMDGGTSHHNITEIRLKMALTLSQTTNFRLFQTERIFRQQFEI